MHGAPSQAPRHSANSSVILPSAVVSPGFTSSLLTQAAEQLLAAAKHARNAAADPHALLAERVLGLAEEAVERHRVVNLGRVQLQQLGDLAIASGDTARSASCTMCSAGSVTACLSGYFGNSARMRSRNFVGQYWHCNS